MFRNKVLRWEFGAPFIINNILSSFVLFGVLTGLNCIFKNNFSAISFTAMTKPPI